MAVEFALRKRTHHEEQAYHEIQWKLKTVRPLLYSPTF